MLALQRTAGNQATTAVVQRSAGGTRHLSPSEQLDLIMKLRDAAAVARPGKPGAARGASGVWEWMKRSGHWLRSLAAALGLAGALETGGTKIEIPDLREPDHVTAAERRTSAAGKPAAAGSGPPSGRGPGLAGGTRYVSAAEQLTMIQQLDELATARPQGPTKPSGGPGGGGGGVPTPGRLGRVTGTAGGLVRSGGSWVRAVGPQIVLMAAGWYLGKKAAETEAHQVTRMLDQLTPELNARVTAMAEAETSLVRRNPFLPIYANVKLQWVYHLQGGVANDRQSTWHIDLLDVELSHSERKTKRRVSQRMDHVWLSVPVGSLNPVHARLTTTFQQVVAAYGRDTADAVATALLQGMHAERVVTGSHWGSGPTEEGGLEDKRRYVAAYISLSAADDSFAQLGAAASELQAATLGDQDEAEDQPPWWMPEKDARSPTPDALIEHIRNLNR